MNYSQYTDNNNFILTVHETYLILQPFYVTFTKPNALVKYKKTHTQFVNIRMILNKTE